MLNKQQGLVIRPFKRAHTTRHLDRELLHLSIYLQKIAPLPSLESLNHRHWERYVEKELRRLARQEAAEDAAAAAAAAAGGGDEGAADGGGAQPGGGT